ncbi:Small nuclear ribonucleoprotein [Musa troglodytarum]|uniref:Small nuclear ribonucleoprotein n=1 Tax=Musa troglodytarum TaxID=320322 RepID=A0A9E7EC51_9LILI|nr:Small nuclear ribonucleoprotein [Musa troglodytarum]
MSRSLGIPVKPLHETARHVVRVELKSGVLYRGIMIECEDNWNCQLGSLSFCSCWCSWSDASCASNTKIVTERLHPNRQGFASRGIPQPSTYPAENYTLV